jgi:hypothetical protein
MQKGCLLEQRVSVCRKADAQCRPTVFVAKTMMTMTHGANCRWVGIETRQTMRPLVYDPMTMAPPLQTPKKNQISIHATHHVQLYFVWALQTKKK